MAHTVLSGKSGAVNGIASCAEWSIARKKTMANGRASGSTPAPIVIAGNEDWSGRMRCYGKIPPVFPGDALAFVGQTGGGSVSASAVVGRVRGRFPVKEGGYIAWDIEFAGNGAVTTGSTSVTDAALPQMYSATPCKVNFAGSDLDGVQAFELELSCELKDYVESQVIKRKAGNFDASASIDLVEGDPATALAPGTIDQAKFYVDASTFFDVKYMIATESEQNVPIETGDLVALRIPMMWSGWKDIAGTRTPGYFKKPDTTAWWS